MDAVPAATPPSGPTETLEEGQLGFCGTPLGGARLESPPSAAENKAHPQCQERPEVGLLGFVCFSRVARQPFLCHT